ncbi:unannotated protein [freshwater metagenome]|uniref:Unannotated protein n=1 Tax=freshwater metagenome TaxID=449393 RepID=A0A6J7LA13_9ZZZZ
MIMCEPVSFRIFESASTCSRSLDTTAGRATGVGAAITGAVAGAAATGAGVATTGAGAAATGTDAGAALRPLRSM